MQNEFYINNFRLSHISTKLNNLIIDLFQYAIIECYNAILVKVKYKG